MWKVLYQALSPLMSRKVATQVIGYVGTSLVFIFGGNAIEKSVDSVEGLVETTLNPFRSLLQADEMTIKRNSQFIAVGLIFSVVFVLIKKIQKT